MSFEAEKNIEEPRTVVFYDGACGMCNAVVMRLLDWDEEKLFFYAPLQSDYAANVLPEEFTKDLSTMVFLHEKKSYIKSSALLEILKIVKKCSILRLILTFTPQCVRDVGYSVVAKCRHLFGKPVSCRVLSEEEQSRFLN